MRIESPDEGRHKKEAGPLAADTGDSSNGYSASRTCSGQDPPAQFGRVPWWIIDEGFVGKLTLAQARVLLVLCGHVNRKDWSCTLGDERIAQLANVTKRTVQRVVPQLQGLGFFTARRGGGRGRATAYRFNGKGDRGVSPFPESNDDSALSPFPSKNGVRGPREKASHRALNGDGSLSPQQKFTENQQSDAAAERSRTRDLLETLHRHGIKAPTDSQLISEHPRLTTALIDEALFGFGPDDGPGRRVNALRERLPKLLEREECKRQLPSGLAELAREYEANRPAIEAWMSSDGKEAWQRQQFEAAAKKSLAQRIGGSDEARDAADKWSKRLRSNADRQAWEFLLWEAAQRKSTGPRDAH